MFTFFGVIINLDLDHDPVPHLINNDPQNLSYDNLYNWILIYLQSVLRIRIRIHRIHMFLGLPDPDPDPLVRGMDPDPLWIRIVLSSCKNSKKNLGSYYFVTLLDFFSLKSYVNVASKSNKQKKLC